MEKDENKDFSKESTNFGLPDGYFQKSTNSIFNKIEWEEENKNFPNLVGLKNEKIFTVPEHYFSRKEQELESIGFATLSSIKKLNPFKVPDTYFEQSEIDELARVLNEDYEFSFKAKLGTIKREDNFRVDENYFSESKTHLIALLTEKQPTKIIGLFSKKTMYAVAALLFVALGFWTYSFYFRPVETLDCGTMACIDKVDLVKTKNLESLDNDELYELVNSKELEKKLDDKKLNKKKKSDVDSSLKNISTDDLLDEI